MTGYIYNCMNNSPANYLRNNFVDHGSWESLKIGQQVGPEVGYPVEIKRKTHFQTYFLTNA